MKKKWLVVLFFILIGSLIIVLNYDSPVIVDTPIIVTADLLKDTKGTYNDHSLILSPLGISNLTKLEKTLQATSRLTSDRSYGILKLPETITAIDVYENYPEFASYFEIDYLVQTEEIETSVPNYDILDPGYYYQNEYYYMNIGNTWNKTLGQGITVAVIDTGIDTDHPEFAGKISPQSYNASADLVGIENVEDEYGHGTAVAGAIAASFDGLGVIGIAPQVTLLVIKCEVDTSGNFIASSDLVFGIYYAIEKDVDVINMSFGMQVNNPFAEALQLAVDSDIIPIASAGNESSSAPHYPAADQNAIGVGALGMNSFELAQYSNYGDNVKIVAPGTVYTTKKGGGYYSASGTSLASPLVSGAVALYLSLNSNVQYDEIVDLLEASSVDLGQLGADWYYGFGALDVDALVCQEKGTVTFDHLTSEIENTSHVFIVGRPLQEYPEPERSMLVYDGWYYDIHTTDEIDYFSDAFTSDLTVYASWINEDEGIPYQYSYLPDGSIQIDNYFGKMRYLVIPNEIEGIPVTSIGINAFYGNQRLRQITLPTGLITIYDQAFRNVTHLLEIKIPSSVKHIRSSAFAGNYRMVSVIIEEDSNLETIGDYAFSQNVNLLRFDIPSNTSYVDGSAFYGCVSIREFTVAQDNPFYESIDSIIFNEAKTILIANPAALTASYTVPSSVLEVGQYAFYNAKRSGISLPEGLLTISKYAFSYASRLASVTIPSTVISIENNAFSNTLGLKQIIFNPTSQLESIGDYTFSWAQNIESISVPASVNSIGQYAFSWMFSLNSVVFESGSLVTSLDEGLFYGATSLTSITLPSYLTSVGSNAFNFAIKLPSISLPDSVTSIGQSAFGYTRTMSSFTSSNNLQSIDDYAFSYSGINQFTIGDSVSSIGEGVFGGAENLSSVLISSGNNYYKTIDGVLYTFDQTELVAYPMGLSTNVVIPSGVLSVGAGAFYGNNKLTSVLFPNTLTHINDFAFCLNSALNNITLPSSLIFIGEYAFSLNNSLTQITIPNLVNSVGRFAFNGNWNLTSILFEANSSLNRIGFSAFAGTGITSISIPANVNEISQGAFGNSINLTTVIFEDNSLLTTMTADIFVNSPNLSSIAFGSGSHLSHIQAHAFDGITKLTSIDLSNLTMLTDIDNYAFFGCSSLTSVNLPNSLERIGRFAFAFNSNLSEISIPSNVSYIGEYAFYGTDSIFVSFASSYLPLGLDQAWDEGVSGYLVNIQSRVVTNTYEYAILGDGNVTLIKYLGSETNVVIDQIEGINVTSIQPKAFENNTTLISITLPNTVTVIPNGLFSGCTNLTSVLLGNSIVQIHSYAFNHTTSLTSIIIPSTVEVIGSYAFASSGLQSMTFETGSLLHTIGDYAFSQSKLTALTLPADVSYIGSYAFYRVTSLNSFTFNTNAIVQIRDYAFFESGLTGLYIPSNIEYVGEFALTANRSMLSIEVDVNNPYYSSFEGVLYNKDMTRLITYPAGKSGVFTIPDSVKVLGFSAFEGSEYLTGIVFSPTNKIMSIGLKAFYGCTSLTSINIPDDIIHIGYYAFANNTSLEIVNISNQSQLTRIFNGAFYNDAQLTTISLPTNVLEIGAHAFENTDSLLTLPYNENTQLVGIYDYAFAGSGITSLVFPPTLKEIGDHAFDNAEVGHLITSLAIPSTVDYLGYAVFANFTSLEEITLPFIGSDKSNVDSNKFVYIFGSIQDLPTNLHDVIFLEGMTHVPAQAFSQTEQIYSVFLPGSVLEIGNNAFEFAGLKDINLPNNLQSIGSYAFYSYQGNMIHIPQTVTYIGNDIFHQSNIHEIIIDLEDIPTSWNPLWNYKDDNYKGEKIYYHYMCGYQGEHITDDGFRVALFNDGTAAIMEYSGKDSNVVIPDTVLSHTVTHIGSYAFVNKDNDGIIIQNTTIHSLVIPNTVHYIGAYALSNLTVLESIKLPDSLTSIEIGLFSKNWNLSGMTIPEGVISIAKNAFEECWNISELFLPQSLIDIQDSAFINCPIKELFISTNVEHIGNSAFISIKRIYFEGNELPPYIHENWASSFQTIVFGVSFIAKEGDYRYMVLSDNTTAILDYYGDAKYLIIPETLGEYPVTQLMEGLFENNKIIEHVSFPDGVLELPRNLFLKASSLKTVDLPNHLKYIGDYAFCQSGLIEIIFPETLTEIGSLAFFQTRLVEITLPNSVSSIKESAFSLIPSLTQVTLPNSLKEIPYGLFLNNTNLKTLNLPSTVESIDSYAFANTGIESIFLPDSIQFIGSNILLNTPLYDSQEDGMLIINGILLNITKEIPYNTTLSIPSDVYYITDGAFGYQPTLSEIYIPDTVQFIGNNLCTDCVGLRKITIPFLSSNRHFDFSNTPNVQEIVILSGATNIPRYSFYHFINLELISIPDTVTAVGDYAFEGCEKLTRIEFLNPNVILSSTILEGCINIQEIVIPSAIPFPLKLLFGYDVPASLKTVILTPGATDLASMLLADAPSLTKVYIPSTVTSISEDAFLHSPNVTLFFDIIEDAWNGYPLDGYTTKWLGQWSYVTLLFENKMYSMFPLGHGEILALSNEPIKQPDIQYTYNYVGWDINFDGTPDTPPSTIGGPLTLNQLYTTSLNNVTVHFYSYQYELLETVTIPYGTSIPGPLPPTRYPDEQYTYIFSHWDKSIDPVIGNYNIFPVYDEIKNQYTYKFFDIFNNVIATDTINYGESIPVPTLPIKEATAEYSYIFTGWDKPIPEFFNYSIDFYPVYDSIPNQYQFSIYSLDNQEVSNITMNYLDPLVLPELPQKEGYSFSGWYLDESLIEPLIATTMPAHDLSIYPKWVPNIYKLDFVNPETGVTFYSTSIEYGTDLSQLSIGNPTKKGYSFIGWSIEIPSTMPANDLVFEALFEIDSYQLTYQDYDGIILYNQNFDYDSSLGNINVLDPARTGYSFTGWSVSLPQTMPDNDIVITATYQVNQYNVTYQDHEGSILFNQAFDYGSSLSDIIVETPLRNGYTFTGWSLSLPTTMPAYNILVTPLYEIKLYTITYIDIDGTTMLKQDTSYYGDPLSPPDMLINYETVTHQYEFGGWSPSLSDNVTEDMTYTAMLKETIKLSLEEVNLIVSQFTTVTLSDFAKLKRAISQLTPFDQYYPEQMNSLNNAVAQYRLLVAKANEALEKSNLIEDQLITYLVEQVRVTDFAVLFDRKEEC